MSKHVIILITVGRLEEAEQIAQQLVEHRLAACVNIVPQIASIYRWQGEICHDAEVLLLAKTERGRAAELERMVKQWHSYELPEIIALEIAAGSQSYLDWVSQAVAELESEE